MRNKLMTNALIVLATLSLGACAGMELKDATGMKQSGGAFE